MRISLIHVFYLILVEALKTVRLLFNCKKGNNERQIHPTKNIVNSCMDMCSLCHTNNAHMKDMIWASLDGPH